MYNLTVATAHTFYVGSGQWLVHNQIGNANLFTPGHGLKGDSDTKSVIRFANEMKANGWANLEPIKVVQVDGKLVVVDGMHRLEAARLTGTEIKYQVVDEAWLKANTGWKSIEEVGLDASMPNRANLNGRLLEKAGLRGCP